MPMNVVRNWLIEARKRRNLTQTEAAEMVGARLRTWQRWESGESTPEDRFESVLGIFPETAIDVVKECLPRQIVGGTGA